MDGVKAGTIDSTASSGNVAARFEIVME